MFNILHIITKVQDIKDSLCILNNNDAIIFGGQAIYSLLTDYNCINMNNLYIIKDEFYMFDSINKLKLNNIKLIDYLDIVDLCCKYKVINNWL